MHSSYALKKWAIWSGGIIAAAAAGAAVMYFYDPERGSARRHMVRARTTRQGREWLSQWRHSKQRTWMRQALPWMQTAVSPEDDRRVAERLRTELGQLDDTGESIDFDVREGKVFLRGAATPKVARRVFKRAKSIDGVRAVENHIAFR